MIPQPTMKTMQKTRTTPGLAWAQFLPSSSRLVSWFSVYKVGWLGMGIAAILRVYPTVRAR